MAHDIRRVGIVGLGKMGFPMARHLRAAGFAVAACDVNAPACAQAQRGGRLVDCLDLHYYPQGTNVSLSDADDPTTAALRLRSL